MLLCSCYDLLRFGYFWRRVPCVYFFIRRSRIWRRVRDGVAITAKKFKRSDVTKRRDHEEVTMNYDRNNSLKTPLKTKRPLPRPQLMVGGSMYDDDDSWRVVCPSCGHGFTEIIGRIKTRLASRCPKCSSDFAHRREHFLSALSEAREGRHNPGGRCSKSRPPISRSDRLCWVWARLGLGGPVAATRATGRIAAKAGAALSCHELANGDARPYYARARRRPFELIRG